jgi:hypothetical protein
LLLLNAGYSKFILQYAGKWSEVETTRFAFKSEFLKISYKIKQNFEIKVFVTIQTLVRKVALSTQL